jgi:DNA-binding NarL/FixJ family response regulator
MDSPASLRVQVVADDPLVRQARWAALDGLSAGVEPVGRGAESPADVILWDLGVSPEGPLEALRKASAGPPVLALAADARAGERALQAQARGALHRDRTADDVLLGLRAVAAGLTVAEPGWLQPAAEKTPEALLEPLTAREQEVLPLLAEGLSNKAIAAQLQISEHTAKFHVNAVLTKLGAQNRVEAVVRAARMGLLSL